MFPGMGMPPGMGAMGGFGGMGDMMPMQADPFAQYQETLERLGTGLVGARVRNRALLELLEEKGILGPGEFDVHAQTIWERDYDALANELLTPQEDDVAAAAPSAPPPPPKPMDAQEYAAAMLHNFVSESVGGRVRMRAVIEILETKGIFAPGEFEARAELIWDRDYEELAMDFYRMNY